MILVAFIVAGYELYQYFRPYNLSPQTLTSSQQVTMNKINAEMKLLSIYFHAAEIENISIITNWNAVFVASHHVDVNFFLQRG